ncbi:MAG TPA: thiosulfate oxidation carrier protein SoxY, partial [Xanthobacteraceae bacterium]|nr:thiosulfate oxidation carrier protein SoxY [Xanthobacteraceae bacterium]
MSTKSNKTEKAIASLPRDTIVTRRRFLIASTGVVGAFTIMPVMTPNEARATPQTMAAAIREITGDATINSGKVRLELPPIVENGNAVPLTVSVESPMTAESYVKGIYIFNEKNPQPNV